jgi:hypothetical protein
MRYFFLIWGLIIFPTDLCAQQKQAEVTGQGNESDLNDSALYVASLDRYYFFDELNRDSALLYANQCLGLTQKKRKRLNEAIDLTHVAYQQMHQGNFSETFKHIQKAYAIATDP